MQIEQCGGLKAQDDWRPASWSEAERRGEFAESVDGGVARGGSYVDEGFGYDEGPKGPPRGPADYQKKPKVSFELAVALHVIGLVLVWLAGRWERRPQMESPESSPEPWRPPQGTLPRDEL